MIVDFGFLRETKPAAVREIDPAIFGPGTWIVSHVLGLVSDQSGMKKDYRFFSLYIYRMVHALPCGECRKHAVKYFDEFPIPKSKDAGSLFEWTVTFHNTVNKRLNKPIMTMTEAQNLYENTEVVLVGNDATCSINSGCEDASL